MDNNYTTIRELKEQGQNLVNEYSRGKIGQKAFLDQMDEINNNIAGINNRDKKQKQNMKKAVKQKKEYFKYLRKLRERRDGKHYNFVSLADNNEAYRNWIASNVLIREQQDLFDFEVITEEEFISKKQKIEKELDSLLNKLVKARKAKERESSEREKFEKYLGKERVTESGKRYNFLSLSNDPNAFQAWRVCVNSQDSNDKKEITRKLEKHLFSMLKNQKAKNSIESKSQTETSITSPEVSEEREETYHVGDGITINAKNNTFSNNSSIIGQVNHGNSASESEVSPKHDKPISEEEAKSTLRNQLHPEQKYKIIRTRKLSKENVKKLRYRKNFNRVSSILISSLLVFGGNQVFNFPASYIFTAVTVAANIFLFNKASNGKYNRKNLIGKVTGFLNADKYKSKLVSQTPVRNYRVPIQSEEPEQASQEMEGARVR